MNNSPSDSSIVSATDTQASKGFTNWVPAIVTFALFVFAAAIGGEIADRGILPLVRFISLLMLALGVYTSLMTGRYCSYSKNRWRAGQAAAGCIGLAGGCVWSATALGFGFILFMIGILLCALLIFREMERNTNRRLAKITK